MNTHFRILSIALFSFLITSLVHAQDTRLVRQPDISDSQIVFTYANDIWITSLDGGEANRLTSFQGSEANPNFSPDGNMVAFTGEYDGNTDVYVVPVEGGEPKRLTWHPGDDDVRGWTPDGEEVIFASGRTSAPVPYNKFWSVSLEGTFPEALPVPRVHKGQFSPNGKRFAYQQIDLSDDEWRNYRGGQARPIWVMNMSDHSITKLPWDGSNDQDPVWIGGTIYFLSDRDHTMNIFAYNTSTQELS
ncbi:MAG TPA: hypothetical protein VJ905_00055, partial [Halalkalibaculum sp.]|nr:hypothetical protein [Halalkalibaculum sp.]